MSKIEQAMLDAIRDKTSFNDDNTMVRTDSGGKTYVFLHGHLIALCLKDRWDFSLCGFNTNTTRSRLNCIASVFGLHGVTTRKGVPCDAVTLEPLPIKSAFFPKRKA